MCHRRALRSLLGLLVLGAGGGDGPARGEPRTVPTVVDLPYGQDSARQRMDVWLAEAAEPTPVVLMIHGGGWMRGDKSGYNADAVRPYLEAGVSVATVNYRFILQAMDDGVEPPVKACLLDAARALQTLRFRADEWRLDPRRVGATGSSAGACTSLWLALHDDLADPDSADPVARQSTRLTCAAVSGAQTSLDPVQVRQWIGNAVYGGHAFGYAAPGRSRPEEFELLLAHRAEVLPWIRQYSPIESATADDPPIFLEYPRQDSEPVLGGIEADPTHSAMYGLKLAEPLRAAGVEVVVRYPGHTDDPYGSIQGFLLEKLKAPAK